jgi:hypothetical protein
MFMVAAVFHGGPYRTWVVDHTELCCGLTILGLACVTDLLAGGSLATGDYVPDVSDLDLVAPTGGPVGPARQEILAGLHRCMNDVMPYMRTTVDLPAELHAQVVAIARDTHRTMSETVAFLVRLGLVESRAAGVAHIAATGLPVMRVGRIITTEDVRALEG